MSRGCVQRKAEGLERGIRNAERGKANIQQPTSNIQWGIQIESDLPAL